MAYDEGLAQRVREVLQNEKRIVEKKMFGGLAFMSPDYMFVGVLGDVLMARVGPEFYTEALVRPHVREMNFTGKPMKGYVFVDPAGCTDDAALAEWVAICHRFVGSLPEKNGKRRNPGRGGNLESRMPF